jgi:hypothetical protein
MGFFRKSSGYPPLHNRQSVWQKSICSTSSIESFLESTVILILIVSASVALYQSVVTHEAFLIFAIPTAGSPVGFISAKLEIQPVMFWLIAFANAVIAVGGWGLIALGLKRQFNS